MALIVAIVGATATIIAALLMTRSASKKQLTSIEVKVDGRLEAALEKIDRLAAEIATLTHSDPPPPVSGLNVPKSPS
jgi:1-aminocyclopropane-1-carboxylate deaminase/D-cysteine desulfhydrase-like pyridoxal-dependent ACC family enzyme